MRLELDPDAVLIKGTGRAVYLHPKDPAMLVKVLRTDKPGVVGPVKRVTRRLMPLTRYRFLFREYQVSLRAQILAHQRQEDPPVAAQFGLVQTNLGLGMVCEHVHLPGEELGRTLRNIVRQDGIDSCIDELNAFAERMFSWGIRANDLHAGNIVLGSREGKVQFVLVDGMGDSHVIPIRSMSDRVNTISLNTRFSKLANLFDGSWDQDRRRFVLSESAARRERAEKS